MIGREPPVILLVKFEVREIELARKSDSVEAMYDDCEQSLKGIDQLSKGETVSRSLYCSCKHLMCVILPRRPGGVKTFLQINRY